MLLCIVVASGISLMFLRYWSVSTRLYQCLFWFNWQPNIVTVAVLPWVHFYVVSFFHVLVVLSIHSIHSVHSISMWEAAVLDYVEVCLPCFGFARVISILVSVAPLQWRDFAWWMKGLLQHLRTCKNIKPVGRCWRLLVNKAISKRVPKKTFFSLVSDACKWI